MANESRTTVIFSATVSDQEHVGPYIPLSALAVATELSRSGYDARIIDAQITPDWESRLVESLQGVTTFGISTLTGRSLTLAMTAAQLVRQARPDIAIIWGGYHALTHHGTLLATDLADYVLIGQAEGNVLEIWDSAAGTPRPVGGKAKVATSPTRVPAIDYELVQTDDYLARNGRILHALTSYGCPHNCQFCLEPINSGRRWVAYDAEQTAALIVDLWQRYSPNLISLHDPNFSTSPRRVADIAEHLVRRGQPVPILCNMRATDVLKVAKLTELSTLRSAGFERVFVGVESGSEAVLKSMEKRVTADDSINACRLLDEAGIIQLTSFIHDYPGEKEQDVADNLSLARALARLPLNRQRHHFYVPYPGAPGSPDDLIEDQEVWAQTSTYTTNSKVSPDRSSGRARIVTALKELMAEFPHALQDDGIPHSQDQDVSVS